MTTLLIVLASLLLVFLLYRFLKYVFVVYTVLACLFVLGIPVAFFDLELGVNLCLWSALGCAIVFFVSCAAVFVSGIFTLLVVAPLVGIWASVKLWRFELDDSWRNSVNTKDGAPMRKI